MRVVSSRFPKLPFCLLLSTLAATIASAPLTAQEANGAPAASASQPLIAPLITQPVDENQLTVLKGNVHPLARPQFDLGTAPASLPMQRMLLVLKRSPAQEASLRKLLDDQQDKHSSNYHKWLTPEQYGKQFGPSDSDMQTITAWLQSHGFQLGTPSKGRTVLEFSGSASQVQEAFHSPIHKYVVNGEQHWANATDPRIPTALTGAVAGVLTLHNFLKKPLLHLSKQKAAATVRPGKAPKITFSDGTHGLGPQDYATIYGSPGFNGSINGSGITIGVIGRSNLFNGGEDVGDFHSFAFQFAGPNLNIILNGPDPGDLGGGEEAEATLDSTWTGAVAPSATVDFVVSASTNTTDGIDLSEVYIVENNLAEVMTESFGSCEAFYTNTDAAGVSGLAEQAAAQGITYFVSTGDEGAEGCDDPNSETVATGPVSVNLLASTPFNVAVGGTMFNENGQDTRYWTVANNNGESVLSYIPENVWNESCTAATCASGNTPAIWAGSGGASTFFTKPSWQSGTGLNIPQDGSRDLPDVSLTAAGHDPYLLCLEGSCVPDSTGNFFIYFISGTSAAAPSFAGIMALVDQQMENINPSQGARQGQAAYVLYKLAASQVSTLPQCNGSNTITLPATACTFYDTTIGNNAVPGEVSYGLPTAQYQAGVGYDLATGLGSVNIANLVTNWNSVTFNPTTTALVLNPMMNIPHGSSVQVNVTVAPTSGTVIPTGDVSLLAITGTSTSGQTSVGGFTLSGGTIVSSTNQLPGGSYNVTAHYAGDATYSPSDSIAVAVTVTQETSTTAMSGPFTQDQFGQWTVPISTPQAYGTPVFVRADVKSTSGQGIPTGPITFTDTLGTIPNGAGSTTLNSEGNSSVQSFLFDAGNHSISAAYAPGDASFSASSSTQPITFTIHSGFFSSLSGTSQVVISSAGSTGSTAVTVFASSGISGSIALACVGLPAEASCTFSPASIAATGTAMSAASSILVTTTAAHLTKNYYPMPYRLAQWLTGSGFAIAGVFMIGLPRRRRAAISLLLLLTAMLLVVTACGGGSSSSKVVHQQDPGTPLGTYPITVNATNGAVTQSTGFTLTVQ